MLGSFLTAAGFGLTGLADGRGALVASVLVWTFGEMIIFPTLGAYVSELAPPERRGQYLGLYMMTFSLGLAFGPPLGVMVLERHGGGALWATTFVVGCVSTLLYLRVAEPRPTARR